LVDWELLVATIALSASLSIANPCPGAYIPVFGGPTSPGLELLAPRVSNSGTAVGSVLLGPATVVDGYGLGIGAVRWDGSGSPAVALESFTNVDGNFRSIVHDINDAGTAVGFSLAFGEDGARPLGWRAMRWDGPGTTGTRLLGLGASVDGVFDEAASAVNEAGTVVGYVMKHDGAGNSSSHAVRWEPGLSAPVELIAPFPSDDYAAHDINDAGEMIGKARDGSAFYPVRWDAAGVPTVLGPQGDVWGTSNITPYAINNAGTAVGYYSNFDTLSFHAIRWDAGSTTYTELQGLGDTFVSFTWGGINDAGVIAGWTYKYDAEGNYIGARGVLWHADSAMPTELDTLDNGDSVAVDINSAGIAVGTAQPAGVPTGDSAVYWRTDGTLVDLNSLIDPASGWWLKFAQSISDTGWITGEGSFDPDGAGGELPYERLFLMHVPAAGSVIPAIPGDVNIDGVLDARDIDVLSAAIRGGRTDPYFDLNLDRLVNAEDHRVWIDQIVHTYPGDANLDREFNSRDLVLVFQAGHYEDDIAGNSIWATGDWNGDAEFDSRDIVMAFQSGGYETGPRMASAVPEPCGVGLMSIVAMSLAVACRRFGDRKPIRKAGHAKQK
jgi:hypothetical protein